MENLKAVLTEIIAEYWVAVCIGMIFGFAVAGVAVAMIALGCWVFL